MDKKRQNALLVGSVIASLFFCQNCATIFNGTTQKIPVTSTPSGVRVLVDGELRGHAPLVLKLKKRKEHTVRLEKPGYVPVEMRLMRQGDLLPSVAGNFFLGSLTVMSVLSLIGTTSIDTSETVRYVGMLAGWGGAVLVDMLTGAAYKLTPDHLILNLNRKKEGVSRSMRVRVERAGDTEWIQVHCAESTNAENKGESPGMNRSKEEGK